ncbi:hypothetical protein FGO68_gene13517 [Halteria grandinella]|uniref:Uncharacterized protein n=1 Tax=Halteria grandinella TaxID=5974 RepID=A0A8J8N9M3_HALGN|nr:hypothetical protein FGO68_gene13517 [Halteria grandinella]
MCNLRKLQNRQVHQGQQSQSHHLQPATKQHPDQMIGNSQSRQIYLLVLCGERHHHFDNYHQLQRSLVYQPRKQTIGSQMLKGQIFQGETLNSPHLKIRSHHFLLEGVWQRYFEPHLIKALSDENQN